MKFGLVLSTMYPLAGPARGHLEEWLGALRRAREYAFDAVVDVVEPLGSEILLDLKAGDHALVARVEPTVRVKEHERLRLALQPERLHFFDLKTELAI